jgi:hypothetical protein
MHIDLKLEHVRRRMDNLHERHARQGELLAKLTELHAKEGDDLKGLCALLTEATQEYAVMCGASGDVTATVIAPKDDPKP